MVNLSLFRQFVPLLSLMPSDRAELAKQARIVSYRPGQVIFNRGDVARSVVYVVSGEVELFSESATQVIKGETEAARNPLSHGAKRMSTATCLKTAQILFVDRDQLDLVLTWAQTGGVEVVELQDASSQGESQDWMTALLQNHAFHRIPPGNIAQIFAAMQPVEARAGDTIIQQGEPGDYYYVVSEGRVQVVQTEDPGLTEQELTQISVGGGFGEEALVSGNPRNATVRALTRCSLMRLASGAFERLLKAPLLKEMPAEEIPPDAQLVDVRLPDEFRQGRLPGAINVPLVHLRKLAPTLDPQRCYVVYCDSGRRSASATYLLCERGFDAHLLAGGVPADEMPVRG